MFGSTQGFGHAAAASKPEVSESKRRRIERGPLERLRPDNSMLPYRMLIARERSHRGVRTHAGSVLVVNMPPSKRKQILKRNSDNATQW